MFCSIPLRHWICNVWFFGTKLLKSKTESNSISFKRRLTKFFPAFIPEYFQPHRKMFSFQSLQYTPKPNPAILTKEAARSSETSAQTYFPPPPKKKLENIKYFLACSGTKLGSWFYPHQEQACPFSIKDHVRFLSLSLPSLTSRTLTMSLFKPFLLCFSLKQKLIEWEITSTFNTSNPNFPIMAAVGVVERQIIPSRVIYN